MMYEDNPLSNLEYLRNLSKTELKMYVNGYIMACVHMREAFSRGKTDLLNVLLGLEGESIKTGIARSIKLLDAYEELVKSKEVALHELFPEMLGDTEVIQ